MNPALRRQHMEKVQEDPRVIAHRAGDVANGDNRRRLPLGAAAHQFDAGPTGPHGTAEGATRIDAETTRIEFLSTDSDLLLRKPEFRDKANGLGNLIRAHLRKILAGEFLLRRHGQDSRIFGGGGRLFVAVRLRQCVRDA